MPFLFIKPEIGKFPFEVGKFDFTGHGQPIKGANQAPLHTEPEVKVAVKIKEPGTLMAKSYCNSHGLWESNKDIKIL